mmetsp:Transcript_29658/g.80999  ORF Transcript_29658/g.80999 Transcript_29658/m.80999 type:complete len:170 (+) Transcript_29658:994-1503(+)
MRRPQRSLKAALTILIDPSRATDSLQSARPRSVGARIMLALQIRSLRRAISPGGVRLDHATSLPLSPCANFHEILSCYASSLLGHGPLRALGSLQVVAERISNLTRAPTRYFEPFQILKYDEGQFYKSHHDQNSGRFTPQGARVYTFFMYLSTPAEGGGTKFTDLGLVR